MINQLIAKELKVNKNQIDATVALIDEGATIPFIARYRKEATGGLDDTQLRYLSERLIYLREMEDRRQSILSSITEQGKLTDDLKKSIIDADTKARLEDLYLPYKQKRRTKGQIAIEAGLEPLADLLINDPTLEPEKSAQDYINPPLEINDSTQALEGARYILMERFSEDADLRNILRDYLQQNSVVVSRVIKGKESEAQKYQDYFDYQEPWKNVPSHRALAILRGRKEGFLSVALHEPDQEELKIGEQGHCARLVGRYFGIEQKGRAGDAWLQQLVYYTWKIKLLISMESELLMSLRERSENDAIQVFAANLKDILMGAPAGSKRVLGLDPGIRTGVKVAVVNETGKVLDTSTIYPFQPQNKMQESIMTIGALCQKHNIDIIAIGNGTASRETDRMVADMMKVYPKIKVQKIIISEAGASVYSASELAAKEMPDLDVSLRGAVSIARRLQDPLAELVKIEPKSIGVGQYQHDVSQLNLSRSLTAVIEDCVNAVGVDINTASAALLSHVSGLNAGMAENIVMHRDTNGRFNTRKQLLDVSRLGPKAFEQAAGFLRILEGGEILDSSAVHPESYSLVIKMAKDKSVEIQELLGNKSLLSAIDAKAYVDDKVGLPTINDILSELDKPGRDPRPDFKTANFSDGVESIKDLKPGMWLEGVISNVAQFGAFVDIGVHQDGLVHISMLADTFIDDPRKVVKAGDVVRVKVLEVEVDRKRISLSMIDVPLEQGSSKGRADKKSDQAAKPKEHQPNSSKQSRSKPSASQAGKSNKGMGAMAKAFANLNK